MDVTADSTDVDVLVTTIACRLDIEPQTGDWRDYETIKGHLSSHVSPVGRLWQSVISEICKYVGV